MTVGLTDWVGSRVLAPTPTRVRQSCKGAERPPTAQVDAKKLVLSGSEGPGPLSILAGALDFVVSSEFEFWLSVSLSTVTFDKSFSPDSLSYL